ncbi:universal stress protein [Amycolatopsis pittospori]|uniref:universal stress protein n=1 Tax=Amycolatopsis pittospori TaxID=2749434 RepID=UPI0015F00F82|nr:universal stress protein [Amycolatopsis pittospori]
MPEHSGQAVVVGIDGAESASRVVRWAAAEARHRHAELRLVHAIDDEELRYPRSLPLHEDLAEKARMRGHRLLRHAREVAREADPSIEVVAILRHERPAQALLAASEDAALLVLGAEQIRPLGRALVGSVAIAVATHARCPVAVVRPHVAEDEAPAEGPVVVGVDGSRASEAALALAFQEASWRGAPLVALHCWDDAFLSALFAEARWTLDTRDIEEREGEVLAERLAGWQETHPDVPVERVVTRGRASDELLGYADRARLLIVGSRGRGGVAGMLLGSTGQRVLSAALCPVIVARAREDGKR